MNREKPKMSELHEQSIIKCLDQCSGQSYMIGHWLHMFNTHLRPQMHIASAKSLARLIGKLEGKEVITCHRNVQYCTETETEQRKTGFYRIILINNKIGDEK